MAGNFEGGNGGSVDRLAYMRDPPRQRGHTTCLDAAPTDGVIWQATVDRSPAYKPRHHRRRAIELTLCLTGGIAVFAALWAIGCAMIAAKWHGQGTTFTPPAGHSGSHTEGSNHGAR